MNENETCNIVCELTYEKDQIRQFAEAIDDHYNINWIVDNMPAAASGLTEDGTLIYAKGFPVGSKDASGHRYLYNHVRIRILIHSSPDYKGHRIVGFEVNPISVRHQWSTEGSKRTLDTCDSKTGVLPRAKFPPMYITGPSAQKKIDVAWTYDIFWVPSDTKWASRWDIYLSMGNLYDDETHLLSIINSLLISVLLAGIGALLLGRALRRDLARYSLVPTDEERADEREETGWKQVHGDVFRPPSRMPFLFSIVVGVSCQVLGMTFVVLCFAAIGFLSPANRGSLIIAMVVLFLTMGVLAGYQSARTHKMFNGQQWQRITFATAIGFPAFVFLILFVLNLFVWSAGSVNAVDFGSMFAVVALWLLVSVPLVFVGAYYGFKREKVEFPCAVAPVPRPVPEQEWYMHPLITMAVGGALPFGAAFVEVYFILTSIWLDQYYYVFGFLLLTFIIVIVTCMEVSIVHTYLQLVGEDYHWWWRSFFVPGASGFYLFLYSVFYYFTELDFHYATATLCYFGYMFLISLFFTLFTGAAGHLAAFVFVKKIYGAVKVE
ncbi:TMN7 [Symbiodinium sp. KB8]|nr:TMN7 [Symbiodinium sp. KB8]